MGRADMENAAAVSALVVIDCCISEDDDKGDASLVEKGPLPLDLPVSTSSSRGTSSSKGTRESDGSQSGVGAFAIAGRLARRDDDEESIDNSSCAENDDSLHLTESTTESIRSDAGEASVSSKLLISAELVDDATIFEAREMKRFKRHHIFLLGCLFFVALVAGVTSSAAIRIRGSLDKEAQQSVATPPSIAPSVSPSMAPTIDYAERIDDYDFITNFEAVVSMDTPQKCSSAAQSRGWEVRIQVTCLDGSSIDEFGSDSMIYQIGSSHSTSPCVRHDNHVMQCDITLQEHAMHHIYKSGFACGTNSGNATMEFSVEPLYETGHCQLTGDMASNLQAMCETGGFILSPACLTANLTAVEERCAIPEEGTKTGLYTTLNVPNTTCAALDLESSLAFRLQAVLWPKRRT